MELRRGTCRRFIPSRLNHHHQLSRRSQAYAYYLIACESRNKAVQEIDSNGLMSRGILQFQDATWADFSQQSGITGDPMNNIDAVQMAIWAVENGLVGHWSCAAIEGVIPPLAQR